MENHVEISILLDYYGLMLTEKQSDIMNMYYNENLSLAEIAEITNTSRQAIHDTIKRCNKQLLEYESKLKCKEMSDKYSETKKYILNCFADIENVCSEKDVLDILKGIKEKIMIEL